MDKNILPGDPFAHRAARDARDARERLARLRDRYRHELMDDAERQELRDEIGRLRRRLLGEGDGGR